MELLKPKPRVDRPFDTLAVLADEAQQCLEAYFVDVEVILIQLLEELRSPEDEDRASALLLERNVDLLQDLEVWDTLRLLAYVVGKGGPAQTWE